MFTALQFSQLVAAAWSGPAAAHFATISHYLSEEGSYQETRYSVSYHPHGAAGPCYLQQAPCPFQAITAAVAAAAAAGVAVCPRHARQAIQRTTAALFGAGAFHRPGFACRARRHRCAPLGHA